MEALGDSVNQISLDTFDIIYHSIPDLKIRKWRDFDVEMLFKILYHIALRPSEGINLKKEDFNLEQRRVWLGDTKTHKRDFANIPEMFIEDLRAYLDVKEEGRLFPNLTYSTAFHWFVKLGKMLNIEAWTTPERISHEKTKGHIFRKSLGKNMLDGLHLKQDGTPFSFKDIPIISKQLRHSKPSVTIDHYLKVGDKSLKDAW